MTAQYGQYLQLNDRITSAVFYNRTKTWPAFFIGLIIPTLLWQLTTFHKTLKYDALDITLPWRYFISDALNGGLIPWWNPYQLHGFAQGTSPETWYPVALLMGFWRGYGFYSLNIEFLLHLLLAAWGFYRLSRTFGFTIRSSQFGAFIFPLSGFFIGHAQHMGWIIAGTWIPHVLASFLLFSKSFKWAHGVSFVISFFLLSSGGYPGLTIVTGYLIGAIGVWQLTRNAHNWNNRKKQILEYLRLIILCICTCALIIMCFISLKSALWRGQGLQGSDSLVGSFYFKHLISLVFPFSTVKGSYEFWSADQSVMNVYMGLPVLLVASIGFQSIKKYRRFIFLAIVSLLFALGAELPFRSWANAVPLWDLFRFPALFRYFFILAFLLLTVQILDDHTQDLQRFRRQLANSFLAVAILSVALLFFWVLFYPDMVKMTLKLSIPSIIPALILQTIAIGLVALLSTLFFRRLRMNFWPLLFLISALDMGIMVQTNGRVSVFSEHRLAPMQTCLKELPKGYPNPSLLDPIGSNEDRTLNFGAIYRNTNMMFKQPSWDGYSPFQYRDYVSFNNGPYYENALQQPFAFLSRLDPIDDDKGYYEASSLLYTEHNKVELLEFQPNKMEFRVDATYPRILVINQNYERHWQARMDGNELSVVKTDQNLLSIIVPAGKSTIKVFYQNSALANTLYISLILFSSLLIILMMINLPKEGWLVVLLLVLLAIGRQTYTLWIKETENNGAEVSVERLIRNNIDATPLLESSISQDRFLDWRDFPRFRELIQNQRLPFVYEGRQLCERENYFGKYLSSTAYLDSIDIILSNQMVCYPPKSEDLITASFNGFEGYAKGWKKMEMQNVLAKNGNRFQELDAQKFSAKFEESFDFETKQDLKFEIRVDTRSEGVNDAGIVMSLQQDDLVVIYKSQKLNENQDSEKWTRTTWQSALTVEPGKYILSVYLWNPRRKNLDLDNFHILVERQ